MNSLLKISVFTIIGFLGSAVNFFLMPVLSHYLTPVDFGYTGLISSYVSLIAPFIGFISFAVISVSYFKINDKSEFAVFFSSVCLIPLLPALIWLFGVSLNYKSFYRLLELPSERWVPLVIIVISTLLMYVELASTYIIITKKIRLFAIFSVSRVICEASLTILFVIIWKMGWKGRIYSWLLTTVIFFIFSLYIFYKEGLFRGPVRFQYMRRALAYGSPLIAHELGKYVINQSDRLFIAKMVSVAETGIYNIGYTVGSVIMILINAMSNYFSPIMMENLVELDNEKKKHLVKLSYTFAGLIVAAFVGLNIISPLLFKYLIDKSYSEATLYVFWISLSYCFWGVYIILCSYLYFYNKTTTLALFSVVNVVLNICLNYFLIKSYGALGAAYATCISFFVVMGLVVWYTNTIIKLPWFEFSQLRRKKSY